ncbi:mannosyltransferase family protein, partial [Lactococcus petauri]|uniref:mannosyltransferase family protein n=1 Tax=Lactococcus petauri TaxID=1940789 RepID=UPI0034DB5F91
MTFVARDHAMDNAMASTFSPNASIFLVTTFSTSVSWLIALPYVLRRDTGVDDVAVLWVLFSQLIRCATKLCSPVFLSTTNPSPAKSTVLPQA